jgi:hypothetical protein
MLPQIVRALTKRKYQLPSDMVSAARKLNVSVSHLRRVVVYKERVSKSLFAKYQALQAASNKPAIPMPPDVLAARDNLTPYFFGILAKLGLNVLIVKFDAHLESPIWKHPGIEIVLDQELQTAQAGQYDSAVYILGSNWFFFHVNDLGKAMQTIKACLAARSLLEITTLLHAETAQELRVWYPATAELINTQADTEA